MSYEYLYVFADNAVDNSSRQLQEKKRKAKLPNRPADPSVEQVNKICKEAVQWEPAADQTMMLDAHVKAAIQY